MGRTTKASRHSERTKAKKEEFDPTKDSYSVAELVNRDITEIPMLSDYGIPKVGITILGGSSDTGKSMFLHGLAMCTAQGKSSFLGRPLHSDDRRVIYISTEDDVDAATVAFKRHTRAYGEDGLENLDIILDSKDFVKELNERMKVNPTQLVVVDAFTDVYGGAMNEANQVREFLNEYRRLAIDHQCSFVFLHHLSKSSEYASPSKSLLLGSQSIEAKSRLVMILIKDRSNHLKRHLCVVKGNFIPDSEKDTSTVLSFDVNSLTFDSTGHRVPYSQLGDDPDDPKRKMKERARELKRTTKLSYDQILKKLDDEGFDAPKSKSTLNSWFNE